jgi:hypothetical protein
MANDYLTQYAGLQTQDPLLPKTPSSQISSHAPSG